MPHVPDIVTAVLGTNLAGSDSSLFSHCAGHSALEEATSATSAAGQEGVVPFGSFSQIHRRAQLQEGSGPSTGRACRPVPQKGAGRGLPHRPHCQAETSLHGVPPLWPLPPNFKPLTLWEPCAFTCMMGTPGSPSHRPVQGSEEVKVATAFRESGGFSPPGDGGSRPRRPGTPLPAGGSWVSEGRASSPLKAMRLRKL